MLRLASLAVSLSLAACAAHSQASPSLDGAVEEVLLPFPPDGGSVTWDAWAGPFIRDYCVQCHSPEAPCFASGCHTAGDPRTPDFEDKSAVVTNAALIRCGISVAEAPSWGCTVPAESFPVFEGDNVLPTDEQRGLIVGWIDAGCP